MPSYVVTRRSIYAIMLGLWCMMRRVRFFSVLLVAILFSILPSSAFAHFDFIVSGAGSGGLATAVALRERGYSVLVVERRSYEQWGTRNQTIALVPEVHQLLLDLGVDSQHLPRIHTYSFFRADPDKESGKLFSVTHGTIMRWLLRSFFKHQPEFLIEISDIEESLAEVFLDKSGVSKKAR